MMSAAQQELTAQDVADIVAFLRGNCFGPVPELAGDQQIRSALRDGVVRRYADICPCGLALRFRRNARPG
jgi:hypothetical protein